MRALAACAVLLLVGTSAAAAGMDEQPIADIAGQLAMGSCPSLLSGEIGVEDGSFGYYGFSPTVVPTQDVDGSAMDSVELNRVDGQITFAGVKSAKCIVGVRGPSSHDVLEAFDLALSMSPLKFTPVGNDVKFGHVAIKTLRAPYDDRALYAEMVSGEDAQSPVTILRMTLKDN